MHPTAPPNRYGPRVMPSALGWQQETEQTGDGKIPNMGTTEKERAIEALKTLPEQATLEDAIERLCFIAKIEEGLRQSVHRPYRIVYRLVGMDQIHILTIHHGSQRFPSDL